MKSRFFRAIVTTCAIGSTATLAFACSLVVNTSDLTCNGPSCTNAASSTVDAAPVADAKTDGDATCQADAMNDSANCGSCGHACAGGDSCVAGVCRGACGGGILYIAPTGSDTYDGCSATYPLATFAEAFARVAAISGDAEIHACAGTYVEDGLTLSSTAIVRGAYDCTSWTRTTTYGAPTFDGTHETTIQTSAKGGDGTTLSVDGAGAGTGATAILDGVTVKGAATVDSNGDTTAILVTGGANVSISNTRVSGADIAVAGRALGIHGRGHSAIQLAFDDINAGSGQDTIGVLFESVGAAPFHDNTISGGSATGGTARAVQVIVSDPFTGANAVRNNDITAGTGTASVVAANGTLAINFTATDFELRGNRIDGGTDVCGTMTCPGDGLSIDGPIPTHAIVDSNRIIGTRTKTSYGNAIATTSTSSLTITNNLLYGGGIGGGGIIDGTPSHDMIVANNVLFAAYTALAFPQSTAITVENNLVFVTTGFGAGLLYTSATTFTSFANNAFVGTSGRVGLDTTSTAAFHDLSATAAEIGSSDSHNVRVDGTCSDETTESSLCFVRAACATSLAACIATTVSGYDATNGGEASTLDPTIGFPFVTTAPCAVTKGGLDLTSSVSTDILGVTRTVPFSIGAYEDDAITCTP